MSKLSPFALKTTEQLSCNASLVTCSMRATEYGSTCARCGHTVWDIYREQDGNVFIGTIFRVTKNYHYTAKYPTPQYSPDYYPTFEEAEKLLREHDNRYLAEEGAK